MGGARGCADAAATGSGRKTPGVNRDVAVRSAIGPATVCTTATNTLDAAMHGAWRRCVKPDSTCTPAGCSAQAPGPALERRQISAAWENSCSAGANRPTSTSSTAADRERRRSPAPLEHTVCRARLVTALSTPVSPPGSSRPARTLSRVPGNVSRRGGRPRISPGTPRRSPTPPRPRRPSKRRGPT